MKLGVISDIHGNSLGLEAVLNDLGGADIDEIVCLGDIVGILGDSNTCASIVRTECAHTVCGNHDTRFFPDRNWIPARDVDALEYEHVMDGLSNENFDWLTSLPEIKTVYGDVTLVHARPDVEDKTGTTRGNAGIAPRDAVEIGCAYLDGGILLAGHTHKQHAVDLDKYEGHSGLVLNPGSVGFPFDRNSKTTIRFDQRKESVDPDPTGEASYAIVDVETQEYELKTVEYDAKPIQDYVDQWNF